jgi:hypothetical protein
MTARLDGTRTEKRCATCRRTLALDEFGKDRTTPDGLKCYCVECLRKKYRVWDLHKKGLTVAEYDEIWNRQGQKCGLCGDATTTGRGWHVDHNHESGKIRGIVCHNCNLGLGHFRDNPDFLRKAIEYLKVVT